MAGFSVAGRQFRTQEDYHAALRDQEKIDEIRAKVNMEQPGEVIRLSADIQAGKYHFMTMVGNDFDDEIYELAEQYKKQGYTRDSHINLSKKKHKQKKEETERTSWKDCDEQMQQEVKALLKQKERRRKLIVILCTVIAAGCFGYYGVYYYFSDRTEMDYNTLANLKGDSSLAAGTSPVTIHYTDEEETELTVLEEYQTLYNKNKKLIGWLKIDDTNIDYPVMQTANNEYYLDHQIDGSVNANGSIFMDYRNAPDFSDRNTLIHGHHMRSGNMFAGLMNYKKGGYYEKHDHMYIMTPQGTYRMDLLCGSVVEAFDDIYSAEPTQEAIAACMRKSRFQSSLGLPEEDAKIVTLSTCSYEFDDARFVVLGVLSPVEEAAAN